MVTGEMVAEISFEGGDEIPLSLAFDPTGQYLATGGQNGHAWVVDVKALVGGASVEEAMVLFEEVGSGGVAQVALGPDGVLATAAHDPNIRLWDIHSGQMLHELAKTPDVPRPVAFGPDGELLYIDGNMERGPCGADLPPRCRSDDRPGREQGDQESHRGRVRALPPRQQPGQLPVAEQRQGSARRGTPSPDSGCPQSRRRSSSTALLRGQWREPQSPSRARVPVGRFTCR